jgi:nicotinamide-nucleotide amidase
MSSILAKATICTIGDEILLGQIQDTNSQWISEQLVLAGIDPVLRMSVGDDPAHIRMALETAFSVSGIVLITGGLGPTKDDLTKKVLADWFGSQLVEHPQALADLEEKLRKRGRDMNEMVRTQALHPDGADYLPNKVGTAPGIWFTSGKGFAIALPGVPYEMKQLLTDEVLPRLRSHLDLPFIRHRFFRTAAVPETQLAMALGDLEERLPADLKLAYLPSGGQVKLRLTGRGADAESLENQLSLWSEKLVDRLGEWIYAQEDVELWEILTTRLLSMGSRVYLEDELSQGKLRQWLEPVLSEEANSAFIHLKTSQQTDESGQMLHQLALWVEGMKEAEIQQFRPFPVPDIAQQMVALRSLEMIRRALNRKEAGSLS